MPKKQFKKEIFNEYINSWIFKIILVISFLIMVYVIVNYCINKSYAIGILSILSSPIYITCGLLLPLFITTANIYTIFNNNYFLSIRLKSKKERLKKLLKNILYSNSLMFLIIILILILGLNLISSYNLEFMNNYQFYNIPNIIYIIFYIVRLYIILMIISLFNGVLLNKFSVKTVVLLNVLFYGILITYPYAPITDNRTSILNSSPLIFEYFQLNSYSSFLTEVICSIYAMLLPILLLLAIIKFSYKKNNINSFKYLVLNDFSYTINSQKSLLLFYLIYLIVYSLIKIFIMNYNDNGFNVVLGLEADTSANFLNVISLFLNILVFIMLGTMLFVKDLSKNKSNIFLRIDKSQWTTIKIMSLSIQFALLLAVGYFITFIPFALFSTIPTNVISLYCTNLIVLILLELIILILIYGNAIYKILISLGLVLLLCFNCICIADMKNYVLYLLIALIVAIIFSIIFFRKNIYKLFESEVLK